MKHLTKITLAAAVLCSSAMAETIDVEMLNKNAAGEKMVFSQELIVAEIGDIIRFIPTDKSHNAQSVKGAIPAGQDAFRGKMNKEVTYEVTEAGLTAVICLPHQGMGMVALIVAGGETDNKDEVLRARVPGKGGKKIRDLVAMALALENS